VPDPPGLGKTGGAGAPAAPQPGKRPSGIERVASFIQRNYSYMVFSMVFLGIVAGIAAPMHVQSLKPLMLPLVSIMVYAMTVTIRFRELVQVTKKLKQITLGLLLNFILLPLLCFFLALAFLSSRPEWAAGFILMGTVPCAGMNVVWTGLLKGDVPLALILAALTMILGIVTIPGITALLAGVYVSVNAADLLWSIATVLAIPLILGILTRQALEAKLGKSLPKYLPAFPPVSAITAMILMFSMLAINMAMVPGDLSIVVLLVLPPIILFPIAFGLSHLICSKVLCLPLGETNAIVYSSGMKHLPLAMGIAFASFGAGAALPIAVSAAFQTVNASVFYRVFQRLGRG
jgi:ACR3 family arsenite transporter